MPTSVSPVRVLHFLCFSSYASNFQELFLVRLPLFTASTSFLADGLPSRGPLRLSSRVGCDVFSAPTRLLFFPTLLSSVIWALSLERFLQRTVPLSFHSCRGGGPRLGEGGAFPVPRGPLTLPGCSDLYSGPTPRPADEGQQVREGAVLPSIPCLMPWGGVHRLLCSTSVENTPSVLLDRGPGI